MVVQTYLDILCICWWAHVVLVCKYVYADYEILNLVKITLVYMYVSMIIKHSKQNKTIYVDFKLLLILKF